MMDGTVYKTFLLFAKALFTCLLVLANFFSDKVTRAGETRLCVITLLSKPS